MYGASAGVGAGVSLSRLPGAAGESRGSRVVSRWRISRLFREACRRGHGRRETLWHGRGGGKCTFQHRLLAVDGLNVRLLVVGDSQTPLWYFRDRRHWARALERASLACWEASPGNAFPSLTSVDPKSDQLNRPHCISTPPNKQTKKAKRNDQSDQVWMVLSVAIPQKPDINPYPNSINPKPQTRVKRRRFGAGLGHHGQGVPV